mmetsp:Transcript_21371/g.61839  ORF Transcript_21371/g.61839 Transcript_21371/m.61839 type:complete len:260 (+) Transcript_21371:80-859(+)
MGQLEARCCCAQEEGTEIGVHTHAGTLEENAVAFDAEHAASHPGHPAGDAQLWTPRGAQGYAGHTAAGDGPEREAASEKVFGTWCSEELSSQRLDVSDALRERHQEVDLAVLNFVRSMVRWRTLDVVLPSGSSTTCYCSPSRSLDELRIRAREHDRHARHIWLTSVREIIAGSDISKSVLCETLETPLDSLTVTLALDDDSCITFRMKDIEERDTFAMCLTLFRNQLRGDHGVSADNLFTDSFSSKSAGASDPSKHKQR